MEDKKSMRLRAMEPRDIDAIYNWENNPNVWIHNASHQPFSRNALTRFIDESDGADIYSSRQLRLMADVEGIGTVGCIDLFDFDPYHRHAAIGMIVDSRFRRQGYGENMLQLLEEFAAQHLNIHLLYCDIAASNSACIALYRKHGYRQVGTRKEWIRNGNIWENAVIMEKVVNGEW